MARLLRILSVFLAGIAIGAVPVAYAQQVSRCASCHFANLERVPAAEMLGDWARSPHGRHAVGCERCHGGDPTSEHPQEAHRGVLTPGHMLSPVNPANLTSTCAPCHRANADAFGESLHQTLLVTWRSPRTNLRHLSYSDARPNRIGSAARGELRYLSSVCRCARRIPRGDAIGSGHTRWFAAAVRSA
jgi:hypothetical protein